MLFQMRLNCERYDLMQRQNPTQTNNRRKCKSRRGSTLNFGVLRDIFLVLVVLHKHSFDKKHNLRACFKSNHFEQLSSELSIEVLLKLVTI